MEDRITAALNAPTETHRDRHIAALERLSAVEVAACLSRRLETAVERLWEWGWQPADVGRIVRKKLGKAELALARDALAAQAVTYEQLGRAVAPEWMDQLDTLEADRWWDVGRPWLGQSASAWPGIVTAAVRLLFLLTRLPALPVLYPPPTRWADVGPRRHSASPKTVDSRVLERIRALLAKAESTEFDAEAEAFTTKAQELMTRHRTTG